MRVEAESHAEEDRRRMEEVESRNRLDGLVYQSEKTIKESREKLPEADVKAAEEALEEAKKAMNEGGTARLRTATENRGARPAQSLRRRSTRRRKLRRHSRQERPARAQEAPVRAVRRRTRTNPVT